MGKRSREVRDADAPYRASYGRPGAGCRTLVIPPSLPTMRRTAGALRVRAISGIGVIDRENTDFDATPRRMYSS